jgi:hypothetical protein
MKMKKEHFEFIKVKILDTLEKHPNIIQEYEYGRFPNAERTRDLNTRFRSDLLYGSGLNRFICKELYSYLNDENIHNAVKRIIPPLTRKF